jgi:catechol 2,3-dioxygenase-like lactoylglutathione lyase family enzyme
MHVIRIDHVSLNCADRARTVAFYEQLLGLDVRRRDASPDSPVFVGPPDAAFGLFADRAPSLRHVALATGEDDQRALIARLEAAGVEHRRERRSVYFPDPDGAMIEVLVP